MTKKERHVLLMSLINEDPFLKDEELAAKCGVSISSIRNDRAELGIAGRNLWFWAPNVPKYSNYDPVVNSYGETNVQGIDYTSAPSVRRLAFNLKLTF